MRTAIGLIATLATIVLVSLACAKPATSAGTPPVSPYALQMADGVVCYTFSQAGHADASLSCVKVK